MRFVEGIYLLLGSNLGDKHLLLQQARQLVAARIGPVVQSSGEYGSEAWGETRQPDFVNQVLQVESSLSPEKLLQEVQAIEKILGKQKIGKWRERLIDVDILYYQQLVISTPQLIIPHPEIQNRNFTLVPLCEIAADTLHPLLLKSHQQLLAESPDTLTVWKIEEH